MTSMQRRKFGNAQTPISVIALGCMSFAHTGIRSADGLDAIDEEECMKTIEVAISKGVNLFNTATFYGSNGESETILGKAIKKFGRDKFFISSKYGAIVERKGTEISIGVDCSPEFTRKSLEGTLARLGTDYVDVYGPARVDPNTPIEETIKALAELKKEGKIRYLSLSEASAETIRRAHAVHPITMIESEFSMWATHLRKKVIPTIRELDIALLAYSPLGHGFLTGTLKKHEDIPKADFRGNFLPRFSKENFEHNFKIVEAVEKIAKAKGVTPAQLALAWVLHQDIFPLPGTKSPQRALENFEAANIKLTKEELDQIEKIVAEHEIIGDRYPSHAMKYVEDQ